MDEQKYKLDDLWSVLDAFFRQPDVLMMHQLNSFDNFVDVYIPNILAKNFPNITGMGEKRYGPNHDHWQRECICNITNFSCARPTQTVNNTIVPLYPHECRLRNCTYAAQTYVTVSCRILDWENVQENGEANVIYDFTQVTPFFMLPIMVKSKYCYLHNMDENALAEMGENRYELGGYFIINGNEKVIVGQERISEDQILIWKANKNAKYILQGEIKSSINQLYYPIKTNRIQLVESPILTDVDVRWMEKNGGWTRQELKKLYESMTERYLYFNIHGMNESMPLGVIFRAFGVQNDHDILELCGGPQYAKYVLPSLRFTHMLGINTQNDAFAYLKLIVHGGFGKTSAEKFKGAEPALAASGFTDDDYSFTSVKNRFDKDVLPHLVKDNAKKVIYIGMSTQKVIDVYTGARPYNDRDHYGNKRLDLTGNILLIFFRYRIIGIINKISDHSVQAIKNPGGVYNDFLRDIQTNDIAQKLENSMATGNFIMSYYNDNGDVRKGIAELLSNLSYLGEISHMRKIQSPEKKNAGNLTAPRRLHESNYGYACLNETPEGDKVGLVKFLAMTCMISQYVPEYKAKLVVNILAQQYNKRGTQEIILMDNNYVIDGINDYVKIMVNNSIEALASKNIYREILNDLITAKRHNVFDPSVSVYFDVYERQIHIRTEGGRFMRPLLVVENDRILLLDEIEKNQDFAKKLRKGEISFWDLLKPLRTLNDNEEATPANGALVELVDANQAEWAMIAITPDKVYEMINRIDAAKEDGKGDQGIEFVHYTHCEIHPITAQGMISSLIPFSDHTPNPRNNYQCSMGKQAIGFSTTSINGRMDNSMNILAYGQSPLVQTRTTKYCVLDKLPHGCEAMLAIACYTGYNQEDSIIINRSSVERGFFNTLNYRTFAEEENKQLSFQTSETFGVPPTESRKFGDRYKLLDPNTGFPHLYTIVKNEDVLIGKYVIERKGNTGTITDRSLIYRLNPGIIDLMFNKDTFKDFVNCRSSKTINLNDHSENNLCKVRVVQYRMPVIGDKFASRYAQKGTNSGMLNEADMPFTQMGEVPDIIMNPHGLPSRMTISKPIELFLGTLSLFTGKIQNGTPFEKVDLDSVRDTLRRYGFNERDDESIEYSEFTMYSGFTGQKLSSKIFYGPMYYQRLKHMVDDKIFWRGSSGPINPVTRQPADGRSRSGGLRIGEMERDALVAHNASRTLKGKFFDSSDKFHLFTNRRTGEILIANATENAFVNKGGIDIRQQGDEYSEEQLPYVMKLLIQYVMACGIDIRINTE